MNNKNILLCSILIVVFSMMLFGCTEGKATTGKAAIIVPNTGTLSITSTQPDTSVLVDGYPKGKVSASPPLIVAGLNAGSHTVKFTLSGYNDVTISPVVTARKITNVKGILTKTTLYYCSGTVSSRANLCPGDDTGLTANKQRTLVTACGAPKCEYTCKPGFAKSEPTAKTCTAKK